MKPRATCLPPHENLRMGEGNCLVLRFSLERNDAGRRDAVVGHLRLLSREQKSRNEIETLGIGWSCHFQLLQLPVVTK